MQIHKKNTHIYHFCNRDYDVTLPLCDHQPEVSFHIQKVSDLVSVLHYVMQVHVRSDRALTTWFVCFRETVMCKIYFVKGALCNIFAGCKQTKKQSS